VLLLFPVFCFTTHRDFSSSFTKGRGKYLHKGTYVVVECMIIYRHKYYIQTYLLRKRREQSDAGVIINDVC
jgi:hypothetical protein